MRNFTVPSARWAARPMAIVVVAVVAACALTATAAAAAPTARPHVVTAFNPRAVQADVGGLTVFGGGTWGVDSIERSAQGADRVVEATVTAIGPSAWNTPDGQRPADADPQTGRLSHDAFIYTPITAQVTTGLKHAAPGETLTFDAIGGKVGPDAFIAEDEPTYQVGDTLVLYLDSPVALANSARRLTLPRDVLRVTPDGHAQALHYPARFDLQDVLARTRKSLGQ